MMDELRELYQEVILDHGKNPRNLRHPPDANREAHGNNPLCGDRLQIFLTIDDQGVIRDAAFEGRGCAISTASASMMTEIIIGKTEAEVQKLFNEFHLMCTSDDFERLMSSTLDRCKTPMRKRGRNISIISFFVRRVGRGFERSVPR